MGTKSSAGLEASASASQRCPMQNKVDSVGPYRFSTCEPGAASCQARATPRGRASPQNRLQRKDGMEFGRSRFLRRINCGREGTENHTVNAWLCTKRAGDSRSRARGTQRQAPPCHAAKRSNTDGSKVRSKV